MKNYKEFNNKKKGFSITTKNKNLLMKWIRTPKEIWDDLIKEFNFTVDACASDKNHLLPKYYTKENSALDHNWDNEVVYCHPMYDIHIPKFINKALSSNCLTVFLLPASTNADYFHRCLYKKDNVDIRFLPRHKDGRGYKMFSDENEEPKCGYLRPLMIVVIDNRS
jgi:site-specific DNA-methyltransferase (adenine-specific)|tara:strand:+ start:60 stop:557 length:498 start_codon:yes stop_codon:yes gene_type:complete